MLYSLNNRQVIADVKGDYSAPIVVAAYWADNEQDLTLAELDAFYLVCFPELCDAAYTYDAQRTAYMRRTG